MKTKYHPETQAIRNQLEATQYAEHSVPLFLTSSFIFDDAEDMRASFAEEKEKNIYSRFTNPNATEFIQKIVALEGAEDGYAFATGMAAIFNTFASLLKSGDHIISARSVFGSTHTLLTKFLPKWGISSSYFSSGNLSKIESMIRPNTKILYAETPSNPGLDILDLEELARIAKKNNLLLVIDNCFATPIIQKPIEYGADLVIHSATKLLDGQGRVLGGVVAGKKNLIREIYLFARNTGPSISPFNAWVLSKSIETLALRVEKHSANAQELAFALEKHPQLEEVRYPFLPSHPNYQLAKKQMRFGGNIVAFEVKGGLEGGKKFLNKLQLCSLTANLGDTRTIASHPASTTHSKLTEAERLEVGITNGLIRISVGLEHIHDILDDIQQALEHE
ncbi:aminotransferase class I/II-fold pyridoxal phosphate-dependent enzyme [bacterium SCSIO 12643]|nr:aminotransferase class I/II-fold pyridoxal phosphate-dependent enzyme [bacterium SCSIO 12643]